MKVNSIATAFFQMDTKEDNVILPAGDGGAPAAAAAAAATTEKASKPELPW